MKSVVCAVVNLHTGQVETLKWAAGSLRDGRLGWSDFAREAARRRLGPGVALSTGPLTGMGMPGGGGMTWGVFWGEERRFYPAEGRLGAMLRLAGVDHLFLTEAAPEGKQAQVHVENGRIRVTWRQAPGRSASHHAYQDALSSRSHGDGVIAVPARGGVLEDDLFFISGRAVAEELRAMGVEFLSVYGSAGVDAADPQDLCRLCRELWMERGSWKDTPAGDAQCPAEYLSIMPGACKDRPRTAQRPLGAKDREQMLLSALGLYWGEYAQRLGGLPKAWELLYAVKGQRVSADDEAAIADALAQTVKGVWEA